MEEKKLEYGGFIEVTMEDMKEIHHSPTIAEVIKALGCCQSKGELLWIAIQIGINLF